MSCIKHIISALSKIKLSVKQSLILWFVGFSLSYIFSSVFTNHVSMHLSDSSTVLDSLRSFDFTILSDWKIHYAELSVFFKLLPVILLLYFIFHSLYSSGVVKQVADGIGTRKNFMDGIRKYGPSFIGLNLMFMLIYFVILGASMGLYFSSNLNPFETLRDADWINRFLSHLVPALLIIFIVRNWHQVAKIQLINEEHGFWKNLAKSLTKSFKNFFGLSIIQIIYLVVIILVVALESFLQDQLDFSESYTFWTMTLIIQLFILLRISLKFNQFWALKKQLDY